MNNPDVTPMIKPFAFTTAVGVAIMKIIQFILPSTAVAQQ
jgi:hypothetical protein